MPFVEKIKKSLSAIHFLYPQSCIHCQEELEGAFRYLCDFCLSELRVLDPKLKCQYCFQDSPQNICPSCRKKRISLKACAAVWDYLGPASTLIQKLKNGAQPKLAKLLAAYLVSQWHALGWPLPDAIIPVPQSPFSQFLKGYNPSALIAEEFSKMMGKTCLQILRRKGGDFSQSKLPLEIRASLTNENFWMKHPEKIFDKTVLLIDDYFQTGATLKCCAETLSEAFPKSIYALTVCINNIPIQKI